MYLRDFQIKIKDSNAPVAGRQCNSQVIFGNDAPVDSQMFKSVEHQAECESTASWQPRKKVSHFQT